MNRIILKTYAAGLFLFFCFNFISAQTFNLQSLPEDRPQFGLRFQHPAIDEADLTSFSGAYEFSVNIPVSSSLNIVGIVPYMSLSFDVNFGFGSSEISESGVGNIFIGLQTNPEISNGSRSVITYGLYLPTSDEDVAAIGLYSDWYGFSKYIPDVLSLYFNYAYQRKNQNGFLLGLEIGPNVLIPTGDNDGDAEVNLHYGLSAGILSDQFLFNAELLGLMALTQDDDFGDRFFHSLNFGVAWIAGDIVPRIFYKIYLREEISDTIDGVFGLGVTVTTN